MIKVAIGIPVYGKQDHTWWGPLVYQASQLYKDGIDLTTIHITASMMTDVNRNAIVDDFLKTDAEYLRWLDADNIDKKGSLRRLIDTQKSLVTGVYTRRNDDGNNIAYFETEDRQYREVKGYTPGEIFPIQAAGMGGCLVHRSVFEDIQKHFVPLDLGIGGMATVNMDDVEGDIMDSATSDDDNKVVDGQYRIRVRQPKEKKRFPFFMLAHGRTEDYGFFEMARLSGHQLWLDTGVEIGHLGTKVYTPADVRERELTEMRLEDV